MRSAFDGRGLACSLALGLGLTLASGCKEFRSCTTDEECEPGDRCLPVGGSSGFERFCGRQAVPDLGSSPSVACNSLQALPVIKNPSTVSLEFGRQVFIGRVMAAGQEQVQVLVASNKQAFLFQIDKTSNSIAQVTGITDLTDQAGMPTDNRVYFRGNSILRTMFSSMTSTDIVLCSRAADTWNCKKKNVSIDFGADVAPATNGTIGFFGGSDKGIRFFDVATVASTPNCDLSMSPTTGVKLSRAIDIGPQHVGMLIRDFGGQAILTSQLASLIPTVSTSCTPQLLPKPMENVTIGAITLGQDLLVAGGSGGTPNAAKVWSHSLSQGGTPADVPICKEGCLQEIVSALSLDNNLLAVGLAEDSTKQGIVEVLKQEGGVWTQAARRLGIQGELFGKAVSISGEYLAVGAPGAGTNGEGALQVFRCVP